MPPKWKLVCTNFSASAYWVIATMQLSTVLSFLSEPRIIVWHLKLWFVSLFLQVWINQGDIILVGLRDYQDAKADVILRYNPDEARNLKTYGELPETGE